MNVTQKAGLVYGPVAVSHVLSITVCCNDPAPEPVEGFITFYDPGWSIVHLRKRVQTKRIFAPQNWYDNEPFAKRDDAPFYRQLRMAAVPDSFGKNFSEQQALVPPDEEVPSVRVVIMGMVIHFLATGDRLFPDYLVRCIDRDSYSNRVIVGCFGGDGLLVPYNYDDDRGGILGLASARKL